ncbi:MAG: thiamine ABC transporter substrate-binding protein [Anaerolineae bacterium]|nr:thiamine ABC transporter substrate-binding protein [Anaerolineae bacterium]
MNLKYKWMVVLAASLLLLTACVGQSSQTPSLSPSVAPTALQPPMKTESSPQPSSEPQTLTVMTHDSFAASEEVIAEFERLNNTKVNFLLSGDTGSALNRAVLTKASPLADVFYGVDNTFLSRALREDIFEPYSSPALADIPDAYKLDAENRALPVDFGDVCINYDKAYFEQKGLIIPQRLQDLIKPEYKGLLVVENPATSSPGLAFLLATIADFGPENYLDFWKALRANDVAVVNDWSTAYYTNFSGSSGKGQQPLVVSYGSSPVAELIFASEPLSEPPTASIVDKNTCFRQIEFVGILKGTAKRALAEKWVDFMLGVSFQEDIPLQMFVYPVNSQAKLPEEFVKFAQIPAEPAMLPIDLIDQNREQWITAWDEAVLR